MATYNANFFQPTDAFQRLQQLDKLRQSLVLAVLRLIEDAWGRDPLTSLDASGVDSAASTLASELSKPERCTACGQDLPPG